MIAYTHLEQFIAAQVISNPALAAFVFTSNPVTKQLTLVRVALDLDHFPVLITATEATWIGGIRVGSFDAQIELRDTGEMGEIEARPEGTVQWLEEGTNCVVRHRVGVEC